MDWFWFASHWPFMTAAGAIAGGCIGWFLRAWKMREEIRALKLERQQAEYNLQVKCCASVIHFIAHQKKIAAGTPELMFTEEDFRDWTRRGGYEPYVDAALQLLVKEGEAKETEKPGYWDIVWSNSSSDRRLSR